MECVRRACGAGPPCGAWTTEAIELRRTGTPRPVAPRLGQGSFRLAVLDAYGGARAVTTEHSLPALEAAHIRPWHAGGGHDVSNGILLRRDVHRLFDLGYVTVRPDLRFAVSPRLRDEFANGRVYYALSDQRIQAPGLAALRPSEEALEWHSDTVFRAA